MGKSFEKNWWDRTVASMNHLVRRVVRMTMMNMMTTRMMRMITVASMNHLVRVAATS